MLNACLRRARRHGRRPGATAFSVFYLATGGVALIGNVAAGMLWDAQGPAATFLAGTGLSVLAIAALRSAPRRRNAKP